MRSPAKFWCLAIVAALLVIGLGGWAMHLIAKLSLTRMKAALVANGEKLSFEENIPARVPESDNGGSDFLRAKAMLTGFDYKIQPTPMASVAPGKARCLWVETNAATWETSDLWPNLREHLRTNRPALAQLRAALARPRLQFDLSYGAGFSGLRLTHIAGMKSAAQRLSASVLLNLRDGQVAEAEADLWALLAIPARWRDDSLLISELVRIAIMAIGSATTWEALQYAGWTEPQLAGFQKLWESMPPNGLGVEAIRIERAVLIGEYARCRDDSDYLRTTVGGAPGTSVLDDLGEIGQKAVEAPVEGVEMFMSLFPRRWAWGPWNSYHDEAWAIGIIGLHLRALTRWQDGAPYSETHQILGISMRQFGTAPPQYLLAASGLAGAYENFVEKLALAEIQRRMAITAIALRRHQLAHGSWPAALADMVPQFLPSVTVDPMDGKPLRYRLGAAETPLLYSVGTDGVDGDGDPRPPTGRSRFWVLGMDAVLPQRASAGELADYYKDLEKKRSRGKK